jgi:hypothetical protein
MLYQTFILDPNEPKNYLLVNDEHMAKILNRLPSDVFINPVVKRGQELDKLHLEVQLLKELSVLGVIGMVSDKNNDLINRLVQSWVSVNAFWLLDIVDDVIYAKLTKGEELTT